MNKLWILLPILFLWWCTIKVENEDKTLDSRITALENKIANMNISFNDIYTKINSLPNTQVYNEPEYVNPNSQCYVWDIRKSVVYIVSPQWDDYDTQKKYCVDEKHCFRYRIEKIESVFMDWDCIDTINWKWVGMFYENLDEAVKFAKIYIDEGKFWDFIWALD